MGIARMAMRGGGEAAGIGCLAVFALFWSGLTLAFDGFITKAAFQQIQALHYPTVRGTITSSKVEASEDSDGTTYRPAIQYTYSVGGKQYQGDRYRYGQMGSGDHSAQEIVARHRAGMQVEVHYAAGDPADAVLKAGLEGCDLFLMMFMLPFNLVMLGLWVAIAGGLRSRLFPPVAGGAKVVDDGRTLRVRLSPWRPFYLGVVVSGGLAFVLVFVFGFGFGFNAPVEVILVAWGLILGGGAIAWLYGWRKLARGDSDLVIDEFGGSVTLPRNFGRQEEVAVPAGKILGIEVERDEARDSDGDRRRSYVPTLIFTESDGSERREKLVQWYDERSAEGFVAWLRERLRIR